MKRLKDDNINDFLIKLLINGTVIIPHRKYKIEKIEIYNTYYQIWYTYKTNESKRVKSVSWVKVPFSDINMYLRREKINNIKKKCIKMN